MLERFKNFIRDKGLINYGEKTLLTVSGGIDSVVLCELFYQAGFEFGIAHCNFKLRGEESDGDAVFVEKLAKKYQVPFFYVEFDTKKTAKDCGISTQMAARDLRYDWFERIRAENNYHKIVTAHHLDDQIETFFINLIRGTGISGLHGIAPKQAYLIRPLLFATRDEINIFLKECKLEFREDSSNASDKYLRNKIRHFLAPVLKNIDPDYQKIFEANINRFSEAEEIYLQQVSKVRNEILLKNGNEYMLPINQLEKLHPAVTYLFEIIREFGFSFNVCNDIVNSLGKEAGKQFFSETHRLIKDRDYLFIRELEKDINETYLIHLHNTSIEKPINLLFSVFPKNQGFKFSDKRTNASLDLAELRFPLTLRKWREGDYFYPLGSNFRQKLSDFFINHKFSLFEKEDCWLLCSGEDIVWVVGYQIDNRFKIKPETSKVFQVEYKI